MMFRLMNTAIGFSVLGVLMWSSMHLAAVRNLHGSGLCSHGVGLRGIHRSFSSRCPTVDSPLPCITGMTIDAMATHSINSTRASSSVNTRGSGVSIFPRANRVCIDYGPRLIGVARSDYFTDVVQPYGTIVNDGNLTDVSYKILKLARQFSASEAVIGVPLDSDGVMSRSVRNINGQLCLNFSNVFSSIAAHSYNNSSFRTVLFDERYSTREARWRIQTDKIKASVDAMSAACILERYIEDKGEGSLSATPCRFPPSDEESTFDYDIIRRHVRALHYGGGGSGGGGGDREGEGYRGKKTVTKTLHGESGDSSAAVCSPSDELLTQSECLAIAERDSQRRKKGTLKRRVG